MCFFQSHKEEVVNLDKGHFDCNYDDDDKDDDDDNDDKLVACSCRNLLFPVWTWTDGGV